MRIKATFVVSTVVATCALVYPNLAAAQDATNSSSADPGVSQRQSQADASKMVPALATLQHAIDAKKVQPGTQFRATLQQTVHLKNGTELPRDTVLVGTIATDQMHDGGTSTLALRFTQAQLKGGKVIPIQADIMGIGGAITGDPTESYTSSYPLSPWDGTTTQVDEPGVLYGFDFHSKIGGRNSGYFVSTKRDDMKLSAGSQISLAIAAQNS